MSYFTVNKAVGFGLERTKKTNKGLGAFKMQVTMVSGDMFSGIVGHLQDNELALFNPDGESIFVDCQHVAVAKVLIPKENLDDPQAVASA